MHISVSDKDLLTVLKNDYISNDIKEDRLYFADFFEILGVLPEPTVRIEIKLYVLNYIITNHPYGFDEVLRTIMDITDDRQRREINISRKHWKRLTLMINKKKN